MSSQIRSLEDAAEHIIDLLQNFLQLNTLFLSVNDGTVNRVLKVAHQQEELIKLETQELQLQYYCSLVSNQPDSLLIIQNILEDDRTIALPYRDQLGTYSFAGIAVTALDSPAYVTICFMDRDPIRLDEKQLAFIKSMASFFGYIIELENDSVTDSLTGLYNRRYLKHLYHIGSEKQFSVMFIDIDDFKDVNDTFGHDFGDLLLLDIAARLKHNVRKSDILIRYGGDEFLICFQHLVDNQDIQFVTEKIKDSFSNPFIINGEAIHISASIGISNTNGLNSSLKELINNADHAMYDIKNK